MGVKSLFLTIYQMEEKGDRLLSFKWRKGIEEEKGDRLFFPAYSFFSLCCKKEKVACPLFLCVFSKHPA